MPPIPSTSLPPAAAEFERAARKLSGRALVDALQVNALPAGQQFGVELEMTRISLKDAREVVAAYLGPQARQVRGGFLDRSSRMWEVKLDGAHIVEVTTPPLRSVQDLRMLQGLALALHDAGACVSHDTGLHVHVDAKDLSNAQIVRLLGLVAQHEDALTEGLKIDIYRRYFCADAPRDRLAAMAQKPVPQGRTALVRAYRGPIDAKYLGVNVEHLLPGSFGTLEMRYFNGTLHPCLLGCHVGLAMALIDYARQSDVLPTAADIDGKADLPTFLHALNMTPQSPTSILLYRNLENLNGPPHIAKTIGDVYPSDDAVRDLTASGASEAVVMRVLRGLAPAARRALVQDVQHYMQALASTDLHDRELLALSRLSPHRRAIIVQTHMDDLRSITTPECRGEAMHWLLSTSDAHVQQLHAAAGELTLPYIMSAPRPQVLRTLAQLHDAGVRPRQQDITADIFQRLATMADEQRQACLMAWRAPTMQQPEPRLSPRQRLRYAVDGVAGMRPSEVETLLAHLQEHGLPFHPAHVPTPALRVLRDHDAPADALKTWQICSKQWCDTQEDRANLLMFVLSQPPALFLERHTQAASLMAHCQVYPIWEIVLQALINAPDAEREALQNALLHVAPHVHSPRTLARLARTFMLLDAERLRNFVATTRMEDLQLDPRTESLTLQARAEAGYSPWPATQKMWSPFEVSDAASEALPTMPESGAGRL